MKTKVVQHVEIYLYRVNERVKVVKVARVKVFQFFKTFLVPSFCLTFRHFFWTSSPVSLDIIELVVLS